mmetsp:Transcript_23852/g.27485  ORF Transcript_23852/g.27485 Transcript_23852/m.27485 type:complete len:123 (+) Transcript_23852:90-458(+)
MSSVITRIFQLLLIVSIFVNKSSYINNAFSTTPSSGDKSLPVLLPSDPNNKSPRTKINVGGKAVNLDALGPVILNKDGTTRKIDNWDDMSEMEQEVCWRKISKRNAERKAVLLKLNEEKEQS